MSHRLGGRRAGRPKRRAPKAGDRLQIVVSTPTFLPVVGGAELGIHEIYSRIGARHDVTIVTPSLQGRVVKDFAAQDYPAQHYRVERLMLGGRGRWQRLVKRVLGRTSILYIWRIARLRRGQRIDVMNFHYIKPHGAALIITRRVWRIPTVLSLVGRSDVLPLLTPSKRWYGRRVAAAASAVAPISNYYLRGGFLPRQTEVIPYGVDVGEFAPSRASRALRAELGVDDAGTMLLCVQRLASVKRVDVLLRVLAIVVKRQPDVVLAIVGQGPEMAELKRMSASLALDDHVRFCGYVDSRALPAYFASAELFVFHSMLETFGIVFAQAMASGLPIVAAATSCVPDVVEASNGIVVEPFDLAGFADGICSLIQQPERRRAIGAASRARAEREFDWTAIAARYEELLLKVAA